jgi:hypothetical protein
MVDQRTATLTQNRTLIWGPHIQPALLVAALPSIDLIEERRWEIKSILTQAYLSQGNDPMECVRGIREAYEVARDLKKWLDQRPIRVGASVRYVGIPLLLGVIAGLLTPRREVLIDRITSWLEALRNLIVSLFGA